MSKNRFILAMHKLAALVFFLMLIIYCRNIFIFNAQVTSFWMSVLTKSFASLFIMLNFAAAVGLFLAKRWSYWTAYFAIGFTTTFLSSAYLPFINLLFFGKLFFLSLYLSNGLFLALIIYLHLSQVKPNHPPPK